MDDLGRVRSLCKDLVDFVFLWGITSLWVDLCSSSSSSSSTSSKARVAIVILVIVMDGRDLTTLVVRILSDGAVAHKTIW